ncbi:MAG: DUF3108 domain-containing protein [Gammaproteobacteria bacterium]|nr:DUF3108 domain-containing protein [Gammaproteobacteria bacterium]
MRFFLFSALLVCCTVLKADNVSARLPADFTATYELYKSGLPVAETKYSLKTTAQHARFESTTVLKGLLSLFNDERIHEISRFDISAPDNVKLSHYAFSQTGKNKLEINSSIDWQRHRISTTIDDNAAVQFSFDTALWDKNSIFLALITHAGKNITSLSFNTLHQAETKTYRFDKLAQKEIEIDDNEWKQTSVWARSYNNKKTIFYLDPTEHNFPLKIEQYKNQQLQATLWLTELNWNE